MRLAPLDVGDQSLQSNYEVSTSRGACTRPDTVYLAVATRGNGHAAEKQPIAGGARPRRVGNREEERQVHYVLSPSSGSTCMSNPRHRRVHAPQLCWRAMASKLNCLCWRTSRRAVCLTNSGPHTPGWLHKKRAPQARLCHATRWHRSEQPTWRAYLPGLPLVSQAWRLKTCSRASPANSMEQQHHKHCAQKMARAWPSRSAMPPACDAACGRKHSVVHVERQFDFQEARACRAVIGTPIQPQAT